MVAVLTRLFGVHNLGLAEDVVQDAFLRALEVWQFRGLPDNPAAWLMAAARNRALDVLRRERTARTFAPELTQRLESEWTLVPTLDERFAEHSIGDDLLRLMFSCCHPGLCPRCSRSTPPGSPPGSTPRATCIRCSSRTAPAGTMR
jgi:RNA polymerase sigma-70 factor (ECF subfamily)